MRLDWGIQIKKGNSGNLLFHSIGQLGKTRNPALSVKSPTLRKGKIASAQVSVFLLVDRIPIDFRAFCLQHQSASLDQSSLGVEGISTGKVRKIFLFQCLVFAIMKLVYFWLCELAHNFSR